MKSTSSKATAFNLVFIISCLLPLAPAVGQSGCLQAAADWIDTLDSPRERVLISHAQTKCDFAGRWVKEISGVAEKSKRERTCNDLVLIWTHKECIYFRDYIDNSAYYPCKNWTREMYRNCISDNVQWFADD